MIFLKGPSRPLALTCGLDKKSFESTEWCITFLYSTNALRPPICRQRCLQWCNGSLITSYQWIVTDASTQHFLVLPIAYRTLVQSWNKCVKQLYAIVKVHKLTLNHCRQGCLTYTYTFSAEIFPASLRTLASSVPTTPTPSCGP